MFIPEPASWPSLPSKSFRLRVLSTQDFCVAGSCSLEQRLKIHQEIRKINPKKPPKPPKPGKKSMEWFRDSQEWLVFMSKWNSKRRGGRGPQWALVTQQRRQRLGFPESRGRAGRAAGGRQTLLQQHGQIPRLSLGRWDSFQQKGRTKKKFHVCFTKQVLYYASFWVFNFGLRLPYIDLR